ncbi:MAG: hypothetical protein U5R14_00380 [Gemmatimonadota bacterium]|nr:hypothetical protein [Gemmatimonadota bacterium]
MRWLDRIRSGGAVPSEESETADAPESRASERASPGLGALFEGLRDDGGHSILDLGEGSRRQLEMLTPYAGVVRFVGLVPGTDEGSRAGFDPEVLVAHPGHPYDVVLAWDVLDRLNPEERASLVARIVDITGPGARLYASVDASDGTTRQPVRSMLVSHDRIAREPVGDPEPAAPELLPAEVERLLRPFTVTHAFSLRAGAREYVARKK